MATDWQIRAGTSKVELNADGRGEVTFVVTNPGSEQDHAVFEVVSGAGAHPAWFEVADPKRLVLPGWTAAYEVKISIPPDAPATPFTLGGRARSADSEKWISTEQVALQRAGVGGAAPGVASASGASGASGSAGGRTGGSRRRNVWLISVAALAIVVLVLVGWLLFRPTDVEVPSLAGESESSARKELRELGLEVGEIRRRQDLDSNAGEVRGQEPASGTPVQAGAAVDLELATHLDGPTLVLPQNGESVAAGPFPHLEWSPVQGANGYRVTVERELCVPVLGGRENCTWVLDRVNISGTTSARPTLRKQGESAYSGNVRWQVAALDDFGDPGPLSERFEFTRER